MPEDVIVKKAEFELLQRQVLAQASALRHVAQKQVDAKKFEEKVETFIEMVKESFNRVANQFNKDADYRKIRDKRLWTEVDYSMMRDEDLWAKVRRLEQRVSEIENRERVQEVTQTEGPELTPGRSS